MKYFVVLSLALQTPAIALAQVDGLWGVTKVEVGTELKTPVAKWFRFLNGQMLSGNGWQQHTVGSYKWSKASAELLLLSQNEPNEKYGAFLVTRNGNRMIWKRNEDGEEVKVYLEAVDELPKSTADEVKGLWDLTAATRSGVDIAHEIDPDGSQYLFLRWDRIYVKQVREKERIQGYWFMNGHRPELKLLHEQDPGNNEVWSVAFRNSDLILTGNSKNTKDVVLTFTRIPAFPD